MRTYLIIERSGKENAIEVKAKSKYDALKNFMNEGMRMYWNGRDPYVTNVCSGIGCRAYVAIVK